MNYTTQFLEREIEYHKCWKVRYIERIQATTDDKERAYWTVQSMAAGAALAKLTDSLSTLKRMQDEDKGQP